MKLQPIAAAIALLGTLGTAGAVTVVNFTQATLTYDETSDFGSLSSTFGAGPNTFGFTWTVPNSVQIVGTGPLVMATFSLPSFTLMAEPGYTLTSATSFIGNIAFTEVDSATTGILASADISVDGGPAVSVSGLVSWTAVLSGPGFLMGYFAESASLAAGSFTSVSVSNASILLSSAGTTLGTIFAQPQNILEYTITAEPVPEPATYLMLLSGVAAIGWVARRRIRR